MTETEEILKVLKEREENDNGKRYTIEDLENLAKDKCIICGYENCSCVPVDEDKAINII